MELRNLVEAAAKRYDVDPLLVHSVIQVESNYNPYAVSAKGAQGLDAVDAGNGTPFRCSETPSMSKRISKAVFAI